MSGAPSPVASASRASATQDQEAGAVARPGFPRPALRVLESEALGPGATPRRPGVRPDAPGVETYAGAKGDLLWSRSLCYDCSGCVAICPFDALEIEFGTVRALMDRCTLCTLCEKACPTGAIALLRHPRG